MSTLLGGAALNAYRAAGAVAPATEALGTVATAKAPGGASFGDMLERAIEGTVDATRAADATSVKAMTGQAGVTDVVLAVSRAELALQTTVAMRDRVVSAYQEIMRMPV